MPRQQRREHADIGADIDGNLAGIEKARQQRDLALERRERRVHEHPIGMHDARGQQVLGETPQVSDHGLVPLGPVCRRASPTAIATVIATLIERKPGCIGMRSRLSAAAETASGTPEDSRPNRRMSSDVKA